MTDKTINIIGAGLAGVEAANFLARRGFAVRLFEARPKWTSPAHRTEKFAELICSNSFKSTEEGHVSALLKEEMASLGSVVIETARETSVAAGKALAVDREGFSKHITEKITSLPNVEIIREEITSLDDDILKGASATIIATGPLTSEKFSSSIQKAIGSFGDLYFYDAIAPIVESDSIDMNIAFRANRWGVGESEGGDYINCPMNREEYESFIEALLSSSKVESRDFENLKCFEGCMPIEIMAERHRDALRHGPMKPVGIDDPKTGRRAYALVQLRQDDTFATLFNMVGFQTRMTYPEQERVFRMIPGLAGAKFARLGSMHRNTFVNAPKVLDDKLRLNTRQDVYLAGQITGVEGYLESASNGICVAMSVAGIDLPPKATAMGSLLNYLTTANPEKFQPMKIMWGIFPHPDGCTSASRGPKKEIRRRLLLERARRDFAEWKKNAKL